jgi:hypothetical protein
MGDCGRVKHFLQNKQKTDKVRAANDNIVQLFWQGCFMPELDFVGWVVAAVCAVMVGIAKSGLPGVSILIVPLMAAVIAAVGAVKLLF